MSQHRQAGPPLTRPVAEETRPGPVGGALCRRGGRGWGARCGRHRAVPWRCASMDPHPLPECGARSLLTAESSGPLSVEVPVRFEVRIGATDWCVWREEFGVYLGHTFDI